MSIAKFIIFAIMVAGILVVIGLVAAVSPWVLEYYRRRALDSGGRE